MRSKAGKKSRARAGSALSPSLRKLLEDARREFMTEIHSNSEDDIAADPNLQRRVKLVGRIDRALKTRGV